MIDIMAIGAHPDDIEIFMGGAVCLFKEQGYRVVICDLTKGESGTYGSPKERAVEQDEANHILSLDIRETLDLPDGNIRNTDESRYKVIGVIRKYRPEIVFSFTAGVTRHPDHGNTGEIVRDSFFLAGLEKFKTDYPPFRPSHLLCFPELLIYDKPDLIIDISDYFATKVKSIQAYRSQVTVKGEADFDGKTFIRSKEFWDVLEARDRMAGAMIDVKYGEPFYSDKPIKIQDVVKTFKKEGAKNKL